MNKRKFNTLIKNPESGKKEELKQLEQLLDNHPYSQVIHAMVARSHVRHKTGEAQQFLGLAAIYSTDRKILKSYIQGDQVKDRPPVPKKQAEEKKSKGAVSSIPKDQEEKANEPTETKTETAVKPLPSKPLEKSTESKKAAPSKEPEKKKETSVGLPPVAKPAAGDKHHEEEMDQIRSEIFQEIEELKKNMLRLEQSEETSTPTEKTSRKRTAKKPSTVTKKTTTTKKAQTTSKTKSATSKTRASSKTKTPGKTKGTTTSSVSKTKTKSASKTASKETSPASAKSSSKSKKKPGPKVVPEGTSRQEASLIKEINSKKEKPVGKKQQEQNQLLEDFVKMERKPVKEDPDQEIMDLARESVNFNDNLVSENLAIIFEGQGKTEKAIEIYKKLIWKYPQKKAYFASRIEKLEKS